MKPPVIILELDKLTKDHYEQINDNEFNCYMLTCSVNLTAERSYDPEGSKLQFLWMYDMQNITSNSRDPGTHTFSLGDHEIWLRVIDASGNFSSIRYKIHVL